MKSEWLDHLLLVISTSRTKSAEIGQATRRPVLSCAEPVETGRSP